MFKKKPQTATKIAATAGGTGGAGQGTKRSKSEILLTELAGRVGSGRVGGTTLPGDSQALATHNEPVSSCAFYR